MMKKCLLLLWLLVSLVATAWVWAAEPVRIGVLQIREQEPTVLRWQGVIALLQKRMPDRVFEVVVLTHHDLNAEIARRNLDFVFTDAAHYVELKYSRGISSPLATVVAVTHGQPMSSMGGVIFARANNARINRLEDIVKQRVVAYAPYSFGGYQVQLSELQRAGLSVPPQLSFINGFQEQVVWQVLSGKADVGFVRTGLLEQMMADGLLDLKQLKVINLQSLPGLPWALSTRLYPEWPFAALSHVDMHLATEVASVLYQLHEYPQLMQEMGIAGFAVPADYQMVEDVMRDLKSPPFEHQTEVSVIDIWQQYQRWLIFALLAFLCITGLMVLLRQQNHRLKRQQAAMEQQQLALRESEQRYYFLFNYVPVPLWVFDEVSLQILEVNQQAIESYGYSREEFLQLTLKELRPPSDLPHLQKSLIQMGDGLFNIEAVHQKKDGGLIDVAISVMPILYAKHRARIALVRDITRRKRMEQALQQSNQELERQVEERTHELVLARDAAEAANKAKTAFLANMSHELRTPMNAILGFSSILRKDSQLSDAQRETLNIINRSGEHLLNLINDVLEMSRIEAGRTQLEIQALDLPTLIQEVVDMMQVRAMDKGLQMKLQLAPLLPNWIYADGPRLRQILINLLNNAVKFTRVGEITLKVAAVEDCLEIEVADTGPGIPLAEQAHIFEPFVQLGEQGGNVGSGLGLAICRQFVELMGGTIRVISQPGLGARFVVCLPLQVASGPVAAISTKPQAEVLAIDGDPSQYRILIVEDQAENQLLLSRLMVDLGLPVKTAVNGEQAIELFQQWLPHLIWMDRRMPVMDGLAATRAIRQLPGGDQVKIVAVTASALLEQRQEMEGAGINQFINKPYRFDEIYACLAQQLGIRYLYREMAAPQGEFLLQALMWRDVSIPLRLELQQALISLDELRIRQTVELLRSEAPALVKILNQLIDNFDYKTILKTLQQFEQGEGV